MTLANRWAAVTVVFALFGAQAQACTYPDGREPSGDDLTVSSTTFEVTESGKDRSILTLGKLKNGSQACMEEIVIEVTYLDAAGKTIDTVTQPQYGMVIGPNKEASFRILDVAAAPKDRYASQQVVVSFAQPRGDVARPPRSAFSSFLKYLGDWAPLLIFLAVIIYLVLQGRRKDSPQSRTLALFEKQVALHEAQAANLARIAAELEKRS